MFENIDGKLYWRDSKGELIGPLDAATPTCSQGNGAEPNF